MVEPADRLGFSPEPLDITLVLEQVRVQHFQGQIFVQSAVFNAIDLTPSARANYRENEIAVKQQFANQWILLDFLSNATENAAIMGTSIVSEASRNR